MYTTVEIVSQLLRCSTLAHLFYARTRSQNSGQDCDLCDSQSIEGATFIVISDRTNSQFAFSNLQSAMLMTPTLSLLITPPPLTQSRCIGTPPLPEQIDSIATACGGATKTSALKALLRPNVSSKRNPHRGQACALCDFQSTNHMGEYYVSQVRLNWYCEFLFR